MSAASKLILLSGGGLKVLSLQPAEATAVDTYILASSATTNFGTSATLRVGNEGGGTTDRALIKFDLSSIPSGSTIVSATLSLYCTTDTSINSRTYRVFRMIQAWVETQATWNVYSTGNNWATAGAFGAADCEQTDIGSRVFTATETLNEFKDFTLTASAVQDMITGGSFTNNGFLIKADTEASDNYRFASSSDGTAANRPKLVVLYR